MSTLQGGSQPTHNDFDLGFEESEDENEYDDRGTEVLPESPFLKQQRLKSQIHGHEAESFAGRMSSPKLFAQQALFPQVTQLRCWKMENGIPTGIGVIDANSSEEDFVQKFRSAMPKTSQGSFKFKMRPLDIDGRELGQEITIAISEHHSILGNSLNAPSMATQVSMSKSQAEQETMTRMIEMLKETLKHSQGALESERHRTATLLEQMAQERIDLASNTASGIQVISERMMDADAKRQDGMLRQEQQRNQQVQDNMATFFQSQQDMTQSEKRRQEQEFKRQQEREQSFNQMLLQMEKERSDRDRQMLEGQKERELTQFQMMLEQERARRDREMQEFRERQEQQRQEWERKRIEERDEFDRKERLRKDEVSQRETRIESELKEKESERLRQHEMRLKELELSAQRDREHSERMMQLQALQVQQEKSGSLKESMKEAMETLTGFGIDPIELAQKMFGGGNDGGGSANEIIGAITSLGGKVAEVVKENVKAQGAVQAVQAQSQMAQQNPMGNPYGLMPYGLSPQQQQQMMQQQMMQQQFSEEDEYDDEMLEQEPIFQNQPMNQAKSQQVQEKPPKPKINLPLATQKNARKALRQLAVTLPNTPQEEWEEVITMSIVNEPAIYHYCQAVSVLYALRETGSNDEMINKIVYSLQQSSLVPNDLNYGG
tara:strand:- start:2814 stop:4802 length:1989 start_codon:yes stop_codon:yes gene_type:complete